MKLITHITVCVHNFKCFLVNFDTFIIFQDLITNGAMVAISNKYGEIPLDKCKGQMSQKLLGMKK